MRKLLLLTFSLPIFLLFNLSSLAFAQNIINLTEKNQLLFEQKIQELQKKEFWEYSKGRVKRKPVSLTQASLIQQMFYRKDQILQEITQVFALTLKLDQEIFNQHHKFLPKETINLWQNVLDEKIIATYDLSSAITTADDFSQLHSQIKTRSWELSLIPYRLKFYLHFLTDIQSIALEKKREVTQEIHNLSEEILNLFKKDLNPTSIYDLEDKLSEEIKFLAKCEYDFVKFYQSLGVKEVKKTIPQEVITLTIRTKEGLIIIYGEPPAISKVKELIEGVSEVYFEQKALINFFKSKNIPGIVNIEEFYSLPKEFKGERKKIVRQTTLRSAILDGELPIIEGLEEKEALLVLKSLGWYAEFRKEKQDEEIEKILDKENKVVILSDTDATSPIFIGRIYWE